MKNLRYPCLVQPMEHMSPWSSLRTTPLEMDSPLHLQTLGHPHPLLVKKGLWYMMKNHMIQHLPTWGDPSATIHQVFFQHLQFMEVLWTIALVSMALVLHLWFMEVLWIVALLPLAPVLQFMKVLYKVALLFLAPVLILRQNWVKLLQH